MANGIFFIQILVEHLKMFCNFGSLIIVDFELYTCITQLFIFVYVLCFGRLKLQINT